jgi:hypothetical protein
LVTKKFQLAIEENEYLRTQLHSSEEIRKNQAELIRLMQNEQAILRQEGLMNPPLLKEKKLQRRESGGKGFQEVKVKGGNSRQEAAKDERFLS